MSIHRYKPVVVTLDYNDAISNESREKEIIKQLSKADERLTKKMREIDLQEKEVGRELELEILVFFTRVNRKFYT